MTGLRIVSLIAWGIMGIYMLPGAWHFMRDHEVRRGDPMRLACLTTALMVVGFNLRWLLFQDNDMMLAILYGLSTADAIFILMLGMAYGRGPRV